MRASIWFGGAMRSGRGRRLVAESWSTEQSRVWLCVVSYGPADCDPSSKHTTPPHCQI